MRCMLLCSVVACVARVVVSNVGCVECGLCRMLVVCAFLLSERSEAIKDSEGVRCSLQNEKVLG
jgi:ferredoxin-like protein FixX